MRKWVDAKEGGKHILLNYRDTIALMRSGKIRSVQRGRKRLTTIQWLDEYMESLEEKK